MRDTATIQTEVSEIKTRVQDYRTRKDAALAAAKQAVEDQFRAEGAELLKSASALETELDRAKAATASHPLEGRIVTKQELRRDRSFSMRAKDKHVTLRGKIVVVRTYEDMPANHSRYASFRLPEFGQAYVQRINAKGERLNDWALLNNDGSLPHGWKLDEEQVAA